jgi:hypothetical protein
MEILCSFNNVLNKSINNNNTIKDCFLFLEEKFQIELIPHGLVISLLKTRLRYEFIQGLSP